MDRFQARAGCILLLLGCLSCKPQRDTSKPGAGATTPPFEVHADARMQGPGTPSQATQSPCEREASGTSADSRIAPKLVEVVKSPRLNTISSPIADAVKRASSAMVGVHDTSRGTFAGVEYLFTQLELGPSRCAESLTAAVSALDSTSNVAKVSELKNPTTSAINEAFNGWDRARWHGGTEEPGTVLADQIAKQTQGLVVYKAAGDRQRTHTAGVTLVDDETREALWIYAKVVEPIIEKRR